MTMSTIVATILVGENSEGLLEAIASARGFVDGFIVINTHPSTPLIVQTDEDCLTVIPFEWSGSFSEARNFALQAASDRRLASELLCEPIGFDYAMTLDTDERMVFTDDWRNSSLKHAVELVMHESGTYSKERFFKLPSAGAWSGPVHESFLPAVAGRRPLPGVSFKELPKDAAALVQKFTRDVFALEAHTQAHPTDPRWWYYLGATYADLGRDRSAVAAFDRCVALRGWNEEGAWACYRAAECMCKMGRFLEAIDWCAKGLTRNPNTAELAWLAGYAAWQMKDAHACIAWARMSMALGAYCGGPMYGDPDDERPTRIGFRNVSALYEGPFDLLRFALRAIGQTNGAELAEASYLMAIQARLEATARKA
jgi:hypothetical protein